MDDWNTRYKHSRENDVVEDLLVFVSLGILEKTMENIFSRTTQQQTNEVSKASWHTLTTNTIIACFATSQDILTCILRTVKSHGRGYSIELAFVGWIKSVHLEMRWTSCKESWGNQVSQRQEKASSFRLDSSRWITQRLALSFQFAFKDDSWHHLPKRN